MSAILIQDMGIPKSCIDCWNCDRNFNDGDSTVSDWMCLLRMRFVNTEEDNRPDWCPLINVPPHGRLIEADKLMERLRNTKFTTISAAVAYLEAAPTIIPADPEAEGE